MRSLIDLIRFHEYGPLFILCGIVGSTLGSGMVVINFRLILFIVLSSMSGFVWNDLMDVEEDRLKEKTRNPIATGRISPQLGYLSFLILTVASLVFLYGFNEVAFDLGFTTLIVWWIYSWGPRLKNRPPFDLLAHGIWPVLYVFMGFALFQSLSARIVPIGIMVFCFGAIPELLQEIRDAGADSRTTVTVIGRQAGIRLSIFLLLVSSSCYVLMVLMGFLPLIYMVLIPFTYFVLKPLCEFQDATTVIAKLRFRGFVIILGMILVHLVLVGGRIS